MTLTKSPSRRWRGRECTLTYTNPNTAARIEWLGARVIEAMRAWLTAPSEEVDAARANYDRLESRLTEVRRRAIGAGEYKLSY